MTSSLRRWGPLLGVLVVALLYRLLLSFNYYGWEESDYGNLAMARGVLDSHFTHYDMAHLPLYYGLSAAVLAVVGDATVATRVVSMGSGLAALALAYLLAERLFDRPTAVVAGLALAFQPEFSLYASTALREPTYAALWVAGLFLILSGRTAAATACMGGAFLTRFDAMFTGMPTLLFHLATRPGRWRSRLKQMVASLAVAAAFVGGWSLYCGQVHGDYVFFRSTVERNVETGGAQEVVALSEFLLQGVSVVWAMFTQILPRKLGFAIWLGALASGPLLGRRLWRNADLRTFLFAWLINTAFWFAVAFVAQHEPNHNLYWKWMFVLVPFWTVLAAAAWLTALRRAPAWMAGLVALALVSSTAHAFYQETQAQLQASERMYRPQVEVARFIEAQVPEGTAMILDNIPACYLNRKHHGWTLHSWFDVEVPHGDEAAMAAWLTANDIRYVIWFKEDWTMAPLIAPYLASERPHRLGVHLLTPIASEPEYGFIFYEVSEPGGGGAPEP